MGLGSEANGTSPGITYYFRIVGIAGTAFSSYTNYPVHKGGGVHDH